MFIDTHAHLTTSRFEGEIEDVISRAADAGVHRIISIACDLEDSRKVIDLAAGRSPVVPTVGIHPCYVHEVESADWAAELRSLAEAHPVAAIGEIGLDYFHAPPEGYSQETWKRRQREFFETQLDLAVALQLPVVVHQRESSEDVLSVLRDFPGVTAVLHCFTGSVALAETFLEMGHYLSFTGVVTFPTADEVRQVSEMVPPDRFMVETDSPYLAPVPYRGKRCEPSYVTHTAERIAGIRKISLEECGRLTSGNASRFFRNL